MEMNYVRNIQKYFSIVNSHKIIDKLIVTLKDEVAISSDPLPVEHRSTRHMTALRLAHEAVCIPPRELNERRAPEIEMCTQRTIKSGCLLVRLLIGAGFTHHPGSRLASLLLH